MEAFWKAAAVILLTLIFSITLGKAEKDLSMVLTMAASCIILMIALDYLSKVAAFLWQLGIRNVSQTPFIDTLLKIAGVVLTSEVIALLCSDAGNSALGKAMQILGNAVILFLSLPLFESFLTMIQEMMGMV